MAKRGTSKNIIVGAAQVFVGAELKYVEGSSPAEYTFTGLTGTTEADGIPTFVLGQKYADTLEAVENAQNEKVWRNVGYTNNGLELQFQPDFGEVTVDQQLDVARLYKQGMKVNLNTTFAEATLENLLVAIAAPAGDYDSLDPDELTLFLNAGELGECPVERSILAVGPGTGDCDVAAGEEIERVYVAHRALSIDQVSVMAKRDEASAFQVSFRLLPADDGSYGKIVDRTVGTGVGS